MPKLIKLYITQVAIGFGIAGVFVALLLWFNIANLWYLVSHTSCSVKLKFSEFDTQFCSKRLLV